jgi:transcriptional regulator with XRE-family HTH domain
MFHYMTARTGYKLVRFVPSIRYCSIKRQAETPLEREKPEVAMVTEQVQQRNKEIGALLAQIRQQQRRSITECAAVVGTSRRRYRAIEHGEVGIEVVKLEALMVYLDIPGHLVWQNLESARTHHRIVRIQPDEMVQIIVQNTTEEMPGKSGISTQV